MKREIMEKIKIPEGVHCVYQDGILKCSKGSNEVSRKVNIPQINLKVESGEIILHCKKGNKKHYNSIKSYMAHLRNLFRGLEKDYSYVLESVFVHFPMTMKAENDYFIINNFLGEKTPRKARILPSVKVEVKGQSIIVSSKDLEAAGQTAANIERATKVKTRDRRIFQDGIFITEKPGRDI